MIKIILYSLFFRLSGNLAVLKEIYKKGPMHILCHQSRGRGGVGVGGLMTVEDAGGGGEL